MDISKIEKAFKKKFPGEKVSFSADKRSIVTLRGEVGTWENLVAIGQWTAKRPEVKNVVSKLTVPGLCIPKKDYAPFKAAGEALGVTERADVVIIGAGISGCGIARELSKYSLKVLVVEKDDDVATGATKANNGNIHPGHAVTPGTLKAKLNIEGNRMYTQWAEELGFELQRSGAMGYVTRWPLKLALKYSYSKAKKNGADGAEIVSGKRARELEPGLDRCGIGPKVKAALWLPSMGLVEPYQVAVALAENAVENGVRFLFNRTVADVLTEGGQVKGVVTDKGIIEARYVINCAGIYADEISAMAGDECYTIHPRKGVIAILDKAKRPLFNCLCEHITLDEVKLNLKNTTTKGGGMCRTPEWNILMGPSAAEISDKEDLSTNPQDLAYAMGRGGDKVSYGDVIRYFAGNRPADYSEDFVIEMSPVTHGFVNVGAIQSPGLASAPAVARMVENIIRQDAKETGAPLEKKENWNPKRIPPPELRRMSWQERDELIKENPAYGRVICRCEGITEGEILAAVRSPVPPASIDAVKRRTRAGMGRCQGGFCQPRVLELLAREQGDDWTEVTLKGGNSNVLLKENRCEEKAGEVSE